MATKIRSEISEKNPYWINKHRYYELKHFCLQYHFWRKEYSLIDGTVGVPLDVVRNIKSGVQSDPTYEKALKGAYYSDKIKLLEDVSREVDPVIGSYVLKGIINGWSYDIVKARLEIPCGKDLYYSLYRKFFWLLDRKRG